MSQEAEKSEDEVEALAALLHRVYQVEAERQGDVRHADLYADLPENVKQFDRVLAVFVLNREEALRRERDEARHWMDFIAKTQHKLLDAFHMELSDEEWSAFAHALGIEP